MRLAGVLAAALVLATPSLAAFKEDAALTRLQARDRLLFATGWRLATANAPFCKGAAPMLGISALDAGGFRNPEAVRGQLGLTGDIAAGAVAPGSPAALAGLLDNDTLVALDGEDIETRFPRAKPAYQRLIDVTAALHDAAARGPVAVTFRRGQSAPQTVTVAGIPACPSRFEVLDGGSAAKAEGTRVIFGVKFPGFDYAEAEFAAAVAHEFAHNLLGHRVLLDARGRSLGNVRLTEREADRLMPWLLANAGYDPQAALTFMQRWGPRHDGGLFRNRNHEGWDERAEAIAAEIAGVKAHRTADGRADWATHFVREVLD